MKKDINKTVQKYIVFFYIYAFFGWIIDVSIVFVSDGVLENRGFLYETICPMYGIAALVLIFLSKRIKGKGGIVKKIILATLWCSILEYVTSLILEVFFGIRWWDYSKEPYNFQGRICLAASVFWGLLSVLFMKDIHPFVDKQVKKVSSKMMPKVKNIIIYGAVICTFADFIISVFNYLK
ncbi:MAG: putative ABC transporter permease [Clostridia bacterium]|nr:putative ABC transporter permease [Clostridia bacterium]